MLSAIRQKSGGCAGRGSNRSCRGPRAGQSLAAPRKANGGPAWPSLLFALWRPRHSSSVGKARVSQHGDPSVLSGRACRSLTGRS